VTTEERISVTMPDGVPLAVTLYLPDSEGPWPAVLEAYPYRKDDLLVSAPVYRRLSSEGDFAVCRVDVRGTGTSGGVATDEYPPQEQQDLAELIAWLAARPWCSGSVGMFGTSYSGFNSIQVAMENPPALKAIIPVFATDDRYTDDVHYGGGILRALDLVDYPTWMLAMNALPPVPSLAGAGWRDLWLERLESLTPWVLQWLEEQVDGPYWRHGSLRPEYERIRAATMIVVGWADGYRNMALRTFEHMRCPKRLLIGPWDHRWPDSGKPGPRVDFIPLMVQWFDRWLRGRDTGVDAEPPMTVFVRRSTPPAPDLDEMRGSWRYEDGWPLSRLTDLTLALADATLRPRDPRPDELEVRGDVGIAAPTWCPDHSFVQPSDQRPDEPYSLVYEWARLDDELEILGHPRLEITVRATTPVAFLSAKLCDVTAGGSTALVSRGILNLTHRESHAEPRLLEPGEPYTVSVELDATSWIFERDSRLRLLIAGSDWPNTWPPPAASRLVLDRSTARLVLPRIRPVDEPTPVPELVPPQQRSAPWGARDPEERRVWRIEHDILGRETRVVIGHDYEAETEGSPDDLVAASVSKKGEAGVSTVDPGRSWARGEAAYEVEWEQVAVRTEARSELVSDAHSYRFVIEVRAREEAGIEWSRRWERSWPRNHQ
jgi:uncharacterized protein